MQPKRGRKGRKCARKQDMSRVANPLGLKDRFYEHEYGMQRVRERHKKKKECRARAAEESTT